MSIVFFCQSCGSKFNIDPKMAGKQGRCKKCGGRMTVPNVEEAARKTAKPELAAVGVGGATAPASSWIGEVDVGKVALAPLTIDRMPALKKPSMFPEDELADSAPYVLAQPERRSGGGRVVSQVSGVKFLWQRQLGKIEKVFRWINQTAYLVSVPFIMVLLLGIMIRSHTTANIGAVVVVALNIARLVSGAFNLAVIPFRDGINWKRLKKPLRRVIEPAATIGLVALAFTFFPWLSYKKEGHIVAALRKFEGSLDDVQAKAKALAGAPSDKKP
jgi:DNA-directed RNA polymerase subunit RPC12/RpoP